MRLGWKGKRLKSSESQCRAEGLQRSSFAEATADKSSFAEATADKSSSAKAMVGKY